MKSNENESFRSILDLRSIIEKVYFKEFEAKIDFPFKLNHTHIKTLMTLRFEGERPMSMISDKLNMEKGSFTPVANILIEHGFIEKIPDSNDKRIFNLSLTEKGRDFSTKLYHLHNTYVNELLEVLSADEKSLYFAAIQLINTISHKIQNNKAD